MPVPQRRAAEERDAFLSRCISELSSEYPQDQASAICYLQLKKTAMAEEAPAIDPELMKQCMLDVQGMNPTYTGTLAMKICASRLAVGAKQNAKDDSGIIDPKPTQL